jgi:hypothetical protein
MLNYFRKLVTGYQLKNIQIENVGVKIRYRGKFTFFDPVSILKEIFVKMDQETPETLLTNDELISAWSDRKNLIKGIVPIAEAEFIFDDTLYEVRRYVTRYLSKPQSIYFFRKSNEDIAIYFRVYDYGSHFEDIKNYLNEKIQLDTFSNLIGATVQEEMNLGYSLDILGHTRYMMWRGSEHSLFLKTVT